MGPADSRDEGEAVASGRSGADDDRRPLQSSADIWQPALAMLALGLYVFTDCVFRGRTLFQRDLSLFSWGWMDAFVYCVSEGSWPLWNPFSALGEPMLATAITQILYPVTWLNLLMPFPAYLTLYAVLHLALGGLGAATLARGLGCSRQAAIVSGAAWASSGAVLSTVHMANMYVAAAWLPWALHFGRSTLATQNRRPAILWGSTLALTLLAGSPEVGVMALAALPALAVEPELRASLRRRPWRAASALALAAAMTLLLSAAQALPTLELQRASNRATLPADGQAYWSNHPFIVAQALLPLAFDPLPLKHDVRQLLFYGREPFLYSIYMGGPLLALVAAGAVFGRNRHRMPLALLGLAALLLSVGPMTPAYDAATRLLPFLAWFRFPAKATLLASLSFAVLAGLGVDAWSSARREGKAAWILVTAVPVALLAGLAWHLAQPSAPLWRAILGTALRDGGYGMLPEFARMSRHLLLAAVVLGLTAALAVVRGLGASAAPRLAALVAVLGVLELATQMRELNPTIPSASAHYLPRILERVPRSRPNRTLVVRYEASARQLLGQTNTVTIPVGSPPVFEYAATRDYPLILGTGLWGIEGFPEDGSALRPPQVTALWTILQGAAGRPEYPRWLQVFGVQYLVSVHREPLPLLASQEIPLLVTPGRQGPPVAHLSAVPDALPRAYWASRGSHGSMEALTQRVAYDPAFDPRDEVLIERDPGGPLPVGRASGTARLLRMKPDVLEIQTESTAEGYAVVVDRFTTGWRATVDGVDAPVLRANGCVRAVRVPAGRHRVSMRYRPRSVLIGLALSALGLVAAVAVWVGHRREDP